MGQPVVHFEIGCRNREKTDAFYTQLFDWKTSDYGPFAKKISTESSHGIPEFMTALGHEPHNYVMIYIEVDDIPTYLARVEKLGGEILVPENAVPAGGSFAWIKDIDGNMLGLYNPGE